MTLALAVLGMIAGILTTLAGQGGGLFLLLAIAAMVGPHQAIAITAPALLLGNLHRAVLFRRTIDRSKALIMIAGALPGAFIGGLLAGAMPAWVLQVLLVALAAVAIARALKWLRFDVPRRGLAPAAFVIGGMTGTAGGAGVLYSPVLLSTGLTGGAYVGTLSSIAVATHVGRVIAYASNGFFTRSMVLPIVVVAMAIAAGNWVGERGRLLLSERATARLEYGVLVMCVLVSLAGVA